MKKIFSLSIMLASAILARENPFFSTAETSAMPMTSNKVAHEPQLTSMTYNFPDQARVLKEATFTFQNVDGSLETRKLEIHQSIDWRNPLVLTQYGAQSTAATPAAARSSSADCGFIQFVHVGNKMTMLTKDAVLRSFSLSDPSSIVIDFAHTTRFSPYEKILTASPFVKVKVTNHEKFARATLTLDGRYSCTVSKTDQGASVLCK